MSMHPLVIISAILFLLNQIIEKVFGIYLPWWHAYGDDLLCMPVVLGFTLFFFQKIHPLGPLYHLSTKHLLIAFIGFSILFEGILPVISSRYTRDFWDILCYGIGTLAFHWQVNLPIAKNFSQFRDVYVNNGDE